MSPEKQWCDGCRNRRPCITRYRVDVQSASGRWDNVEIRDDEAIARQDEAEWRSWMNENRGQWKDVRIVEETTTAKVLPFNPIQPKP